MKPDDREALLERVYRRGTLLKLQRRVAGGIGITLAAAALVAVPRLVGGEERAIVLDSPTASASPSVTATPSATPTTSPTPSRPPAPRAMRISISTSPASPQAGTQVTFTVTVTDDATISDCYGVDYGEDHAGVCSPSYACASHYASHPSKRTFTFTHLYATPGVYTARFTFISGTEGACPGDVYGEKRAGTIKVTVLAPVDPTPSG